MIRHSNPPGQPLTALYLLHVGSMDARLIGLSTERHWKHQVKLASALNQAEVVLVDCDRPGIEAAVEQLASHPRIGVVYYAFHPKDHAQRFPNRLILGKPLNLEALPARDFWVVALPMSIGGGSGAPLRAIALVGR